MTDLLEADTSWRAAAACPECRTEMTAYNRFRHAARKQTKQATT